jgi:hypothetical protein
MSVVDPKQDRESGPTDDHLQPRTKSQRERDQEEFGLGDRRPEDSPAGDGGWTGARP